MRQVPVDTEKMVDDEDDEGVREGWRCWNGGVGRQGLEPSVHGLERQ
jgi:hypothetical protein